MHDVVYIYPNICEALKIKDKLRDGRHTARFLARVYYVIGA
jgi:hypothetical protein